MKPSSSRKSRPMLNVAVPNRAVDSFNASDTTFRHGDLHIDQSGVHKENALTPELVPNANQTIKSLEDIEFLETLGRGASSIVRKALHRPSGLLVAVKEISVFDKEKRRQLLKELQTLYEARCEQLVAFHGAFYKEGSIYIALELMHLGSLSDLVAQVGPVPEFVIAALCKQILRALTYLHKKKHMVHRDVKPSNVLLCKDGGAKMADFGVSTELQDSAAMAHTFVGTCTYMSPERITGADYSYPSDIWSLGICVMECALGKYPYETNGVYFDLMQSIVTGEVPCLTPASYSESIRSFADLCLRKEPDARATASQLLRHPFADVGDDVIEKAGKWIVGKMCRAATTAT